MRAFAFWMSVATIVAFNAVLCLVLLGAGETVLLGRMLTVLHVVLPISGLMMFVLMAKDRYWPGVVIFAIASPVAIAVGVMGVAGPSFSQGLHAVTDLCGLNVYLIVVPRYRLWYRLKHAAQSN